MAGDHLAIVIRQLVLLGVAFPFLLPQLGQVIPDVLDVLLGQHHRRQVRLGEVAVVPGLLLGAHGEGLPPLLVKAAGLLHHPLSPLQKGNLPLALILNGPGNGLKGAQVLHLGAGTQGIAAHRAHGQVYIAPQGALLHLAVGHTQVLQSLPQQLQIGHHLLRRAKVRLGDDLQQGHPAAVEVAQGLPGGGVVV